MGLFPSYTSSIFGLKYAGENYAYVLMGMVLAALGAPLLSSIVLAAQWGQRAVFVLGILFALVALVCVHFLDRRCKMKVQ